MENVRIRIKANSNGHYTTVNVLNQIKRKFYVPIELLNGNNKEKNRMVDTWGKMDRRTGL